MRTDPDSGCSGEAWNRVGVICRFNLTERNSKTAVLKHVSVFEDLTGVRVCPVFSDEATAFDKLGSELAAGSPPDFWTGGDYWIPALASRGHLLEIEEYVQHRYHASVWADYYEIARQDVEFGGHIYGIPFRADHRGTPFVRPSMMERAGIPVEVPSTWDELNEFTRKLTVKSGDHFIRSGINLRHEARVYMDWLLQAGNLRIDESGMPLNSSADGRVALEQHVRHGLRDGTMPPGGVGSPGAFVDPICAGTTAYQQLWASQVAFCQSRSPEIFGDLLPGEPLMGPAQKGMHVYFEKYMVWRDAEIPDAAFEAITYLSSTGPALEINISSPSLPYHKFMETYEIFEREPYRQMASNMQFGQLPSPQPRGMAIRRAISNRVRQAALGTVSVRDSLDGMDSDISRIQAGL